MIVITGEVNADWNREKKPRNLIRPSSKTGFDNIMETGSMQTPGSATLVYWQVTGGRAPHKKPQIIRQPSQYRYREGCVIIFGYLWVNQ